MKKKQYIQPAIEVEKVQLSSLIMGSGDQNASVGFGGDDETPATGGDGNFHNDARDYNGIDIDNFIDF